MDVFLNSLGSTAVFLALYFEVFLLISLFEKKKRPDLADDLHLPNITILVPCFNEEKTIEGTIDSLLDLDYPTKHLNIIIINDGSTDNTKEVLKKFENNPIIKIIEKSNGGKYTALNLGIEKSNTEFIGCLDADSFVDRNALKIIMRKFADPKVMAVTPSMVIHRPDTLLQKMQKAEYNYGNFMRKAFSSIGTIHITPGPFSFFRKEVFKKIGPYRHAHNTEDMEMAMRMQKNGMVIKNAPGALVYTVGPESVKKLYKQRVRWVSGFIANLMDYRHMIFSKKYGDLGVLVLPFSVFGIVMTFVFVSISLTRFISNLYETIKNYIILGSINWNFSFEWFYIDTSVFSIMTIYLFLMILALITYGHKTATGKWKISIDSLYFILLYSFIAPFWLAKALYNNLKAKEAPWR